MVTIFTHKPSLPFGEDRCTQFRVIVVTDPQIHKPTDRTDYNTLRRSLARSVSNDQKWPFRLLSLFIIIIIIFSAQGISDTEGEEKIS